VSKSFGKWHQKTNKREDTNKLTLLPFKIIAILHNTLLATSIKLLQTANLFRNRSQNHQLAPADFFLFPHLKGIMRGARFAGVAAIQKTCDSGSAIDS
jgi:hypothetical protein